MPDFSQQYLPEKEIISWMERLGATTSFERKNIRQRIYDARQRGELPKRLVISGVDHVKTREFFGWACGKKGWEVLGDNPILPRDAAVGVAGVEAKGQTQSVYVNMTDVEIELLECKAMVASLERENGLLNRKLNAQREAGKEGGRGNKK
jgi:hypothetical protein|tara:strand:- start:72 stop:521 length:450 start_codon:yes stop_codon:yes gene_type:complete